MPAASPKNSYFSILDCKIFGEDGLSGKGQLHSCRPAADGMAMVNDHFKSYKMGSIKNDFFDERVRVGKCRIPEDFFGYH